MAMICAGICAMTCVPDRWSRVQLSDKHQAESLAHFTWQAGDLVLTDAGYKVVTSLESTQARGSQFLQRTTASHLAVQDEAGKSISLKDRVQRQGADSLREFKAWVQVKTGVAQGRFVEITSPQLTPGTVVVVQGQVGLADGAPVAVER